MDEQASTRVDTREERKSNSLASLRSAFSRALPTLGELLSLLVISGLLGVVMTVSLWPVVPEPERAKYEEWLIELRRPQFSQAYGEYAVRQEILRFLLEYDRESAFSANYYVPIVRDGARMIMSASIDEAEPRQSRSVTEPSGPIARLDRLKSNQELALSRLEEEVTEDSEAARSILRLTGLPMAFLTGFGALGERDNTLVPPELLAHQHDNHLSPAFVERAAQVAARITEFRRLAAVARATPFDRPVAVDYRELHGYGLVTNASNGPVDFHNGQVGFHSGLDIGAFAGAPIVATAPGTVAFAGSRGAHYGNVVEIDHGQGFKTRYAGLSDAQVRRGDHVVVGQRIGSMGATAEGHGTCLHYEVWFRGRAVEPVNFLRAGRFVYRSGS